jgi:hypothetical protein
MEVARDLDELKERTAGTRRPGRPVGGSIHAELTPNQRRDLQRKGQDCMQVLAYLDAGNIIPREFPDFRLASIPQYRAKAKQIVAAMGPTGASLVSNALRAELMRAGAPGLPHHPDYCDDLFEIFAKNLMSGEVSAADRQQLREAMAGALGPEKEALAAKLDEAISSDLIPLDVLADLASSAELKDFRTRCRDEFRDRIPQATITELLQSQSATTDRNFRRRIRRELEQRGHQYSEIKQELLSLWELTQADDPDLAAAARSRVVNAFQRAPMSHCLLWIGEGNPGLTSLIWEQIDRRTARADADRRAAYRDSAVKVLGYDKAATASRSAAIELLERLDDRRAAGGVIDCLLDLPRELWPAAGGLLQQLTGQDFGPRAGDSAADALEAQKAWEAWWNENGG